MEFKTPTLPAWVAELRHPQYRNIFSYGLGNRNLWGTETLLGDWDGEYLLIAQDFYPSSYIEEGLAAGLANPYRHKPGIPTNRNLEKTLLHFGCITPTSRNVDCNFLYISACFLLRADGVIRGHLPDEEAVLRLSAPVVTFTIENMPNLLNVIAMGGPAARAIRVGGIDRALKERSLAQFEVSHPARAMTDDERFGEWTPVFNASR